MWLSWEDFQNLVKNCVQLINWDELVKSEDPSVSVQLWTKAFVGILDTQNTPPPVSEKVITLGLLQNL